MKAVRASEADVYSDLQQMRHGRAAWAKTVWVYEGLHQQTDLDIWEFVLQELDGSLCQAIRVE